jgi:Uma2 family endonuclease
LKDTDQEVPDASEADAMPTSSRHPLPATPGGPTDHNGSPPPLEGGDRLTRDEFERRYDAMPQLKKAELIEGVVHVGSAVRCSKHGEPHSMVLGWLFLYRARTPGIRLADNVSLRLDLGNMPQPDCVMFVSPELGGQATLSPDDYIGGPPDLIAEVAASSASYDLYSKLDAYRIHGVREYIVWRVLDRHIDWFVLCDGEYKPLAPAEDGTLRSTVFPGLWLDPTALLSDDLETLLAVLERGLRSPEHTEFKGRLQRAAARPRG